MNRFAEGIIGAKLLFIYLFWERLTVSFIFAPFALVIVSDLYLFSECHRGIPRI